MNDVYEAAMMLDFYGQLLTSRQYEILDLYYNNDYSLGEISEHLDISRQAVFDNIKRSREILLEYETKLGLVRNHMAFIKKAKELLNMIKSIDSSRLEEKDRETMTRIEKELNQLIDF